MDTGYLYRSLVEKLGIKAESFIGLLDAPEGYLSLLEPLPNNVIISTELTSGLDFIQFFTKDREVLETMFPLLKSKIKPNGMLWISWPKMVSKVPTDLNENTVMKIGLSNGLVDTKVIAINEVWSGLKFVYRVNDRH